jgi:hypothetical protein
MPKPESFPIDKIYVPVKRKKALKPELVEEIAKSILEIGQQAPILVRRRPLRSGRGTSSVGSMQGARRKNDHRIVGLG